MNGNGFSIWAWDRGGKWRRIACNITGREAAEDAAEKIGLLARPGTHVVVTEDACKAPADGPVLFRACGSDYCEV